MLLRTSERPERMPTTWCRWSWLPNQRCKDLLRNSWSRIQPQAHFLLICKLGSCLCRSNLYFHNSWQRLLFHHIWDKLWCSAPQGQKDRSPPCLNTCPKTLRCCIHCIWDSSLWERWHQKLNFYNFNKFYVLTGNNFGQNFLEQAQTWRLFLGLCYQDKTDTDTWNTIK